MDNLQKHFKKYPVSTAVVSKLITTRDEVESQNRSSDKLKDSIPEIVRISDNIFNKIKQNGDLLQLFPDIELCTKIVISSVLCPNDMATTSLSVHQPVDLNITDSIKEKINTIIEDYINENYKIESKLYDIIKESLFEKGACVYAVIPEASLDDMVNKRSESESTLSNLYSKNNLSNEGLGKNDLITSRYIPKGFSDKVIKLIEETGNKLFSNMAKKIPENDKSTLYVSSESIMFGNKTNKQIINIPLPVITDDYTIIKSRDKSIENYFISRENSMREEKNTENKKYIGSNYENEETDDISEIFKILDEVPDDNDALVVIKDSKSASRRSVGKPLLIKLPTESVVPIHAPGEEDKHIGYFVVLDEYGVPIDISKDNNNTNINPYQVINGSTSYVEQETDYLNNRTNNILKGTNIPDQQFEDNDKIYGYLVKEMIKDKILNSGFANLADVNEDINLYQMMFHRALRNMKTQIVFLPATLVQYFAFDYRNNGTGKSELEKMSLLFSIRGTLFISTILAELKNSISTTNIDLELDSLDKYPQETLDKLVQTFINNREPSCGFGLNNINDIYSWIVEHQYKVNVNADGLPAMKVSADDTSRSVQTPDSDFLDKLAEMQYLQLGVTPEMVNRGQDVEFATTIVNNHLLLGKESRAKQLKVNSMVTRFYSIILKNDFTLRRRITNLLLKNKKRILDSFSNATSVFDPNTNTWSKKKSFTLDDNEFLKVIEYIIKKYEKGMTVELPEIIYKDAKTQFETLTAKFDEVDTIVDQLFDSSVLETVFGPNKSELGTEIQTVLKAYLKKKITIENGFYPEITDMFIEKKQYGLDDSRINIFNSNIEDYKNLALQLVDSYENKDKIIKSLDTQLEKYEEVMGVSGGYGGSGGDYGDNNENEDGEGNEGDGSEEDGMDEVGDIDKMLDDLDAQSFGSVNLINYIRRIVNENKQLKSRYRDLTKLINKNNIRTKTPIKKKK